MLRTRTFAVSAFIAVLTSGVASSQADARTTSACRSAAARERAALPYYTQFLPYSKIGQALCFDFTGDGRRDLVVTRWEAMNHGAHYWAAFKHVGSRYVRLVGRHDCCSAKPNFGMGIAIRRQGPDIVVEQPVYRSDDAYCCPTGGSKLGRWSFRGGRLKLVFIERTPAG